MQPYHRARRVGLASIALALVLRLYTTGIPQLQPHITAFLTYLETGQDVRFSASSDSFSPDFAESPPASPTEPVLPAFSGEETVEIFYAASKNPDIPGLLARPLAWNLYGREPTVLILHTHATESYTKTEEVYDETSSWRTLDEQYNLLSIGDLVARQLQAAGIPTVQDRELHDYPSYNGSYTRARKSVKEMLKAHPTVKLVLDLHRDAAGEGGRQMRTQALVEGTPSAQLMVVLGTNHPDYTDNLSLGLKLHALLEQTHPGIMRPLQLRAQRFNQDLSVGALLIEVGAAGNTHQEARTAAKALADAVIALAEGTLQPQ